MLGSHPLPLFRSAGSDHLSLWPMPHTGRPDRDGVLCLPAGNGIATPRDGHHILPRHHRVVLALEHAIPSLSHFHGLLCTL